MRSIITSLLATAAVFTGLATAALSVKQNKRSLVERDGVVYNVFEHAATGAKIEFVNNSGICETTKGVNQYSGYLSVGTNMNRWFWFFEPIGVGFSYGTDLVTSTETAALPEFAKYILEQNKTNAGEKINIVALGINNGWFDAKIQEPAYTTYLYNNSHKPLISKSQYTSYINAFNSKCLPALNTCYSRPLANAADFDVYDIRASSNDPEPPEMYVNYLTSAVVVKAIGAKSTYQECSDSAGNKFSPSGDSLRLFLDELSDVVSEGITMLIWAGDADWICNWYGVQDVTLGLYKVKGKEAGQFKTEGNLSFLRVYDAALQAFVQTMKKGAITST
ncbi:alpha/beta-hydrolase [Karstenula rhodostoma CBS 690.94]|uniref:Alpha/beta-hydrolase n=1 Tax=Karstenula rhodostoma CBS 690.94 TaxID=1392251 RepID=A0A9P4P593_9PLEO|nr:alpha/beta-hydrolase [Karstenula rhodostoma CBS 690.94]